MPSVDADIRNRIVALVKKILEQNAIAADVTTEVHLVDIGLTSMDMVNLMLGLEAEFDFTIPQDMITPESFRSVATLECMVTSELRPTKCHSGTVRRTGPEISRIPDFGTDITRTS